MILRYPSVGAAPIIMVVVCNLMDHSEKFFPVLLDTGADETCFPSALAAFFGHDNAHPAVQSKIVGGVGGSSPAPIHSLRLSLIDPVASTKKNLVKAWTSSLDRGSFVDALTASMGLVGRDVMAEWKRVAFRHSPKLPHSKWMIEIEI